MSERKYIREIFSKDKKITNDQFLQQVFLFFRRTTDKTSKNVV
jgi:hypothetical protein